MSAIGCTDQRSTDGAFYALLTGLFIRKRGKTAGARRRQCPHRLAQRESGSSHESSGKIRRPGPNRPAPVAWVAKSVDAPDSKSGMGNHVRVRVSPQAPTMYRLVTDSTVYPFIFLGKLVLWLPVVLKRAHCSRGGRRWDRTTTRTPAEAHSRLRPHRLPHCPRMDLRIICGCCQNNRFESAKRLLKDS